LRGTRGEREGGSVRLLEKTAGDEPAKTAAPRKPAAKKTTASAGKTTRKTAAKKSAEKPSE
jgi:hypothetical protein